MKTCGGCGQALSAAGFHRNRSAKDGLASQCKKCRIARMDAWQKANPEKVRVRNAASRARHLDREAATGRAWRIANRPHLAAKVRRRRALKKGLPTEKYRDLEIFERDGWICQLCQCPVDAALRHPDPMSASIDHRIPISAGVEFGASDTPENVQLAHLVCNKRKSWKM